ADQVLLLEAQRAASDCEPRWQQLRDGAADHRFAGARLADQPENLSGCEIEGEIVDRRSHGIAQTRRDCEIACLQHVAHRPAPSETRTSSVRRRPSPSRLKPVTVTKIAIMGSSKFHGD